MRGPSFFGGYSAVILVQMCYMWPYPVHAAQEYGNIGDSESKYGVSLRGDVVVRPYYFRQQATTKVAK